MPREGPLPIYCQIFKSQTITKLSRDFPSDDSVYLELIQAIQHLSHWGIRDPETFYFSLCLAAKVKNGEPLLWGTL